MVGHAKPAKPLSLKLDNLSILCLAPENARQHLELRFALVSLSRADRAWSRFSFCLGPVGPCSDGGLGFAPSHGEDGTETMRTPSSCAERSRT